MRERIEPHDPDVELPDFEIDPPRRHTPITSNLPEAITPALDALPGVARVAAYAALHTAEWSVRTSAHAWLRVGRAVTNADEAVALVRDLTEAATAISVLARSVSTGVPLGKALMSAGESLAELAEPPERSQAQSQLAATAEVSLRQRGAELLERSRDVWNTDTAHPAYERILDELAPDEARILLLLLKSGPQPSVDVRTGGPIGMVSSQLIAPGLTMIGARAGCRYLDQVPSYLNNLSRLGLVWFSRESLRDPMEYQVVEAQPDVAEAMHTVKFAKVVRRSIQLTPFGDDFCKLVLLEEDEVVGEAFPEHGVPPDLDEGERPKI